MSRVFAFALVLFAPLSVHAQPTIFWQDGGNQAILRADANGRNVQTIVNTGADGTGLAVDFAAGKVYWSVVGASRAIRRANVDGSNVETIISSGLSVPEGITLDTLNGKIYWADQGASKISRANLDGTNRETLVTTITEHPHDVDLAGGKMYWTDSQTDAIYRANLDGSSLEAILNLTGDTSPRGIAIDEKDGKIYFANQGAGAVQRINLDGSMLESVFAIPFWNGPDGVAVDSRNGKVYFTGLNENLKIQQLNPSGSNVKDLVTTGLSIPRHIDVGIVGVGVIPEPSTVALVGAMLLGIGICRCKRRSLRRV